MPRAIILDCEGPSLTADEHAFFRDADPLGFIIFARHCESPEQVKALCAELRECVGRADAPIMIDQEGGRVIRMKPPVWATHPAMGEIGALWAADPQRARQAARLNAYLLGRMVSDLGVNVNCVPSLDVLQASSDPATLGDRTLADDPDQVIALGACVIEGSIEGGALPVIKHIPGLGRATVDSHQALPHVTASLEELRAVDFKPFYALREAPMGMTSHVVYDALDPDHCATHSKIVIKEVIRGEIGFDGLLFTDDLKMGALEGSPGERVENSLAAGCDIALCCNFSHEAQKEAASAAPELSGKALRRTARALAQLDKPQDRDLREAYAALTSLISPQLA